MTFMSSAPLEKVALRVLSLKTGDDAFDGNEVPRQSQILRRNSHRKTEQLRQMENRQVQSGLDGLSGSFLVNIQTHMAERTGGYHEIGAVVFRVFHIGPGHGDGDGLLFQDDREPATLGPACVGTGSPPTARMICSNEVGFSGSSNPSSQEGRSI